jgi:hypothetical protein
MIANVTSFTVPFAILHLALNFAKSKTSENLHYLFRLTGASIVLIQLFCIGNVITLNPSLIVAYGLSISIATFYQNVGGVTLANVLRSAFLSNKVS